MSQYKTDAQWAHVYELPLSIFLGEEPFNPQVDWASMPCGYDDYINEKLDAQREVVRCRKAWGEDDEGLSFGDYLRKYMNV